MTVNTQNKLKNFYKKAEDYFKTSRLYVLDIDKDDVDKTKDELKNKGYFITSVEGLSSFALKISLSHINHIENPNQYDEDGCFIKGSGVICPSCGTEWEDHFAVVTCPCMDDDYRL